MTPPPPSSPISFPFCPPPFLTKARKYNPRINVPINDAGRKCRWVLQHFRRLFSLETKKVNFAPPPNFLIFVSRGFPWRICVVRGEFGRPGLDRGGRWIGQHPVASNINTQQQNSIVFLLTHVSDIKLNKLVKEAIQRRRATTVTPREKRKTGKILAKKWVFGRLQISRTVGKSWR